MIKFDAKNHKYYNDNSIEYISVTTLLSEHFPFNIHEIIKKIIVNPNSKYYKRDKASIIKEWNNTARQGSFVHNAVETYIKKKTYPSNEALLNCVNKFAKVNFKGNILSETLVWDDNLRIAGTTDLLEDCPNEMWLYDIKTSNDIGEEKLQKYSYQLEIYKRLTEKTFKKKVYIGGIFWFNNFVKNLEETKLQFVKPLNCINEVDNILEKRKSQIIG